MAESQKKIKTRDEALGDAEDLVDLIGKPWEPQLPLIDRVKLWLTPPVFYVLPPPFKARVYTFCVQFWPDFILRLDRTADMDMESCEYEDLVPLASFDEVKRHLDAISDLNAHHALPRTVERDLNEHIRSAKRQLRDINRCLSQRLKDADDSFKKQIQATLDERQNLSQAMADLQKMHKEIELERERQAELTKTLREMIDEF